MSRPYKYLPFYSISVVTLLISSILLAARNTPTPHTPNTDNHTYSTTKKGPINDLVMMGMANSAQKGAGLHQRLRSRAFVTLDSTTNKRFAFVSLDAGQ